ncbi:MAG TPA: FAD-binding protein [Gemmatimonadaceae bacterium]|nr:FAD-binding protein [Gemmatimonadaceae bacterium]
MLLPSDTAELALMVRDAHDRRAPLRIVGGGRWQAAGAAVATDATRLEVRRLAGIVEYVPGDLTLTARAGATLADVDDATAPHGQWCPVLPWGDDAASLGAVFATATTGPFERALGRPRDLALGLEFVDGTGATVRAGGRVVKNVAGFDLTRLLVGSWGTLGVITEVSVRLRARPAVDETWALAFDWSDEQALARRTSFERGPYAPLALRRLESRDCQALGLAADRTLLARLGGNGSFVAAARNALRNLGNAEACDASTWTRYRMVYDGHAPPNFAAALADPLSQRVRQQFDPRYILNRGIFGGRPE